MMKIAGGDLLVGKENVHSIKYICIHEITDLIMTV